MASFDPLLQRGLFSSLLKRLATQIPSDELTQLVAELPGSLSRSAEEAASSSAPSERDPLLLRNSQQIDAGVKWGLLSLSSVEPVRFQINTSSAADHKQALALCAAAFALQLHADLIARMGHSGGAKPATPDPFGAASPPQPRPVGVVAWQLLLQHCGGIVPARALVKRLATAATTMATVHAHERLKGSYGLEQSPKLEVEASPLRLRTQLFCGLMGLVPPDMAPRWSAARQSFVLKLLGALFPPDQLLHTLFSTTEVHITQVDAARALSALLRGGPREARYCVALLDGLRAQSTAARGTFHLDAFLATVSRAAHRHPPLPPPCMKQLRMGTPTQINITNTMHSHVLLPQCAPFCLWVYLTVVQGRGSGAVQ